MHKLCRFVVAAVLAASLGGCQKSKEKAESGEAAGAAATTATAPDQAKSPAANQQIAPPMDVAQPPADALKSEAGMPYVVLAPGKSDKKPGPNDTVMVNYTGWRTTGEMFYTTVRRGSPQPMSLSQVAEGWVEALTDMTVGEKRLYWMPPELASRGRPGPNQGTMVFEIELVGIEPAPPVPEDVAAAPADAVKTKSGVAYKVLEAGTGKNTPKPWDQVMVHYTGWTTDGKMIDSTLIRKRPRPMQLFRESPGWVEALQTMVVGQRNRIWLPEELRDKRPGMPPGMLVYDVELVELKEMPEPPAVPADVAAPPKDAKKTAGGVFYKVLKKGTGTEKPTADSTVEVHYTGWTTDGKMFDSSVVRGKSTQFPLQGVIRGWTEGLQTMVVGETTRFWVPEELAYQGKPNRPQGMLVFDVELLDIKSTAGGPQMTAPAGHGGTKRTIQVQPKQAGAAGGDQKAPQAK